MLKETQTIWQGIVYDHLSDEDKEAYEATFARDGELPESIASSSLNEWIFKEYTIKEVLNVLMTNGITIDYGQKIGKIIHYILHLTIASVTSVRTSSPFWLYATVTRLLVLQIAAASQSHMQPITCVRLTVCVLSDGNFTSILEVAPKSKPEPEPDDWKNGMLS